VTRLDSERLQRIELAVTDLNTKLDTLIRALATDDDEASFDLDGNRLPPARDDSQSLG
jgi:hypothetical protein